MIMLSQIILGVDIFCSYHIFDKENIDRSTSLRNLMGKMLTDNILDHPYISYTIERENFDGLLP